jgi:hypothetical protein
VAKPSAGTFWTGLLQSLAVYAVAAVLVVVAFQAELGATFWLVPVVAFAVSLWIAVWNGSSGRTRTARGAYTGTVLFLLLVLAGILAIFAYALRALSVTM